MVLSDSVAHDSRLLTISSRCASSGRSAQGRVSDRVRRDVKQTRHIEGLYFSRGYRAIIVSQNRPH